MVVYDLICTQGHQFEGWFKDLSDLEDQLQRRLLVCPVCGDENISRRPSTFGLVRSNRSQAPEPAAPADANQRLRFEEVLGRLEELTNRLERDFDDVGSNFADEALKMHYGVTDRRNIRGLSTAAQEELLHKEGVEFYKMPLFKKNPPSTKN